jgi:hypothetical protein
MKGACRYRRLDCSEHRIIIKELNCKRNRLITVGRYTDAVDELLVGVID